MDRVSAAFRMDNGFEANPANLYMINKARAMQKLLFSRTVRKSPVTFPGSSPLCKSMSLITLTFRDQAEDQVKGSQSPVMMIRDKPR